MPLPDAIEIVPPIAPADALVTVPGSKSITNRVLILAALGDRAVELKGALWSDDTQVMVDALQRLGFVIDVRDDPAESSNRTIIIDGHNGAMQSGGTASQPLDLYVGNAGTAARFLAAFVCLGQGAYRLHGTPRMHERPQAALFQALRSLGYRIETPNDRLPAVIHGEGPRPGACRISIAESSQFASALLLCARRGGWLVEIEGENAEESPYVQLTSKVMSAFATGREVFQIEPDASSGSYIWAADWLLRHGSTCAKANVRVRNWPQSGWQIDARFPDFLPGHEGKPLALASSYISRETDLGDSIMTAITLAPLWPRPTRFKGLARLRVQECDRVQALHNELLKCGAKVEEEDDCLAISPSSLHGARIQTYDDHRMAMCFATLGLKVPGMIIENPACVKKTFPGFYQKLAAQPPGGLGARIFNAKTRVALAHEDLFAT